MYLTPMTLIQLTGAYDTAIKGGGKNQISISDIAMTFC